MPDIKLALIITNFEYKGESDCMPLPMNNMDSDKVYDIFRNKLGFESFQMKNKSIIEVNKYY